MAMAVPKPDRFVWFGDIHGLKPYEFIGVSTGAPVLWHPICGQTCRQAPPVDKTAVKDRSRPAIRARHYRSPAASGPNLVGSPGAPNVKSLKLLFSAHCGPPCFSKRNTTEQRNASTLQCRLVLGPHLRGTSVAEMRRNFHTNS